MSAGLAVHGQDYVAYLADAREVTNPAAGKPISGQASLNLPDGEYQLRFFSPITGRYFGSQSARGGRPMSLELSPFTHDVVIRATRSS